MCFATLMVKKPLGISRILWTAARLLPLDGSTELAEV